MTFQPTIATTTIGALCALLTTTPALAASPSLTRPTSHAAPEQTVTERKPGAPTSEARSKGMTKPGDATMGWKAGPGHAPATASPPNGPLTTPNTTARRDGTVKTRTTLSPSLGVQGIDVSGHTTLNAWEGWVNSGVKFLYTKATEGNYYKNPQFTEQYNNSYRNRMLRGAYHFGNPSVSPGAPQADFFINRGGGWSADGRTLPGVLDIEWNPYGDACYDMTQAQMSTWITAFIVRYKQRTGIYPVIYTATRWFDTCVGSTNYAGMPLWIADYDTQLGALPKAWAGDRHVIWQNAALDTDGYDTNIYNGPLARLQHLADTGRRR